MENTKTKIMKDIKDIVDGLILGSITVTLMTCTNPLLGASFLVIGIALLYVNSSNI